MKLQKLKKKHIECLATLEKIEEAQLEIDSKKESIINLGGQMPRLAKSYSAEIKVLLDEIEVLKENYTELMTEQ